MDYSQKTKQFDKKIRRASTIATIAVTTIVSILICGISLVVGCEIGKKLQSEKECKIKVVEI